MNDALREQFIAVYEDEWNPAQWWRHPYAIALRDIIGLLAVAGIAEAVLGFKSVWFFFVIFAILEGVVKPIRRNRLRWQRLEIGRSGVAVRAALVQANNRMFQPKFKELPCLVLFSFDERLNEQPELLLDLARQIFALKNTKPKDPVEREVSAVVTNELAARHRRRLLPLAFTGGAKVYAADLWIEDRFLRKGYLSEAERVLLCFAALGDNGGIEMVPYQAAEAVAR